MLSNADFLRDDNNIPNPDDEESETDDHIEERNWSTDTEQYILSEEENNEDPSFNYYIGKDQKTKSKKALSPKNVRTRSENIITHLPGVKGEAKNAKSILDCWNLFIDDIILECIVTNTNIYIRNIQQNYSRERDANLTNLHEIKALLGIIYFLGVMKANKLNTDDARARDSTGFELCRIAMSENRFRFFLRVIRFDDKATRNERLRQDKLVAVRLILDTFVKNCQKHYSPSEYITVDEKLDAFRGKCNFRQYIPSKHNKYGIKLFALVDSKMFYTCNLEIYSGKNPEGSYNVSNSPSDVVERLREPIKGTGRNVTMDNWFTSYSLALKLLQQYRLTIVGTLKRNKKEIPSEFFISRDMMDEMTATYNCARNSRKWSMIIFYSLLNIGAINSQIIHFANGNASKVKSRRHFLKTLSLDLIEEMVKVRTCLPDLHTIVVPPGTKLHIVFTGEVSMQKVKVQRYISGRRPKYAPDESSEEESEDDTFPFEKKPQQQQQAQVAEEPPVVVEDPTDRRLRRLQRLQEEEEEDDEEERLRRHRHIHEPEVLAAEEQQAEAEEAKKPAWGEEEESSEEELDDEEFERRRYMLRLKAQQRQEPEEILGIEDELPKSDQEESEESEYESYTDSEEEVGQRLKPVFVRKQDRVTLQDKAKLSQKEKERENEAKKLVEERRRQTLKMLEDEMRKELAETVDPVQKLSEVCTDDENEEADYEAWKLRELKRIKRNKEEREAREREAMEIERLHSMTEEERKAELRANPKIITNKAVKGKYKFLQKYFHRGAFYLDDDQDVLKRDFSIATLEDQFDKTVLPKVMQVKNFGRSGRTKYTHLVDQDTTQFDSPWAAETTQNLKFHTSQAGGCKQVFTRPSVKKQKK
ncbi:hypothetical protein LAZ67_3003153 [Cordylochernes scorpioides]|uniref:Microfibrillar-associated protein 1 n=1 Tax=Cordylochernes scorpioides TaxID=51811 RepID=A0ABY6KB82_9ARAC|nr:hypothetical protein LAZ67_3003153 [Cordylochernes scorpioides]